jgi:preprotein translocase subunit SecG
MFVFILIGFIIINERKISINVRLKNVTLFLVPFFIIIILIEILSQLADDSYIIHTFLFAETIVQGSPSEGLNFVFKYFYEVEKIWGILVLLFFIIALILNVFNPKKDKISKLLILSTIAYLIFGSYVVFTEKMVFYGRVLHMYFPFIVLGALFLISKVKWAYMVVLPLCLINYFLVLQKLNSLDYPRSLINEYNLFENKSLTIKYENELECGIDYSKNEYTYLLGYEKTNSQYNDITLLNFCFFNHYPDNFIQSYLPKEIKNENSIILEKKHFMSSPEYLFEYCTKSGRDFYQSINLKLLVIDNNLNKPLNQ